VEWRLRTYDIRLQRERVHRRAIISMLRRCARVVALHVLDGSLLAAVVLALSGESARFAVAGEFAPVIVAIYLLSLNAMACYQPGDARRDWRRMASAVLTAQLILTCLAVFEPRLPLAPEFLGLLALLSLGALGLGRKVADLLVRQAYLHGFGLRRALLIGTLDEVGSVIRQIRDNRNVDQFLVGHLAPDEHPDPTAIGALSQLPEVLDELDVQEVILATSLPAPLVARIAETSFERGIVLYVFPTLIGALDYRAVPQRIGACPLLHLYPTRLEVPTFFVKRAFDLIGAVLLVIALAPLMAAIALAILMDSKGPVFFRQERVGLGGRRFIIWKFRSMKVDAEGTRAHLEHLNAYPDTRLFKLEKDPRITRVGRLLRRSSLDELPQLFNVLQGDMSLVGPRPPLPSEVAEYHPHHFVRLAVLPGITGPWQVNGRNLITDFETVVQLERSYIQTWSLLMDVKILFRTISVVLRGEGAY